jgi:hypothetical protein
VRQSQGAGEACHSVWTKCGRWAQYDDH